MPQPAQSLASTADLVAGARRGEPAAVRAIIRQQNQRLYRMARAILGDAAEAEDALQEAYVRAFASIAAFRGDAQLGTWLGRIVINEALGRLRRRRPTVDLAALDGAPADSGRIIPFPSPPLDPERAMAQREIHTLVEQAIDRLPPPFRAVLVARLVEDMSIEETAAILGILPETVKTRLHRARHLVRRDIERSVGDVLGAVFPFAGRRCDRLTERVLDRLGLGA
jgi:RNA polymerase sigma-70 factor (ECF subfamily)